MKKMYEVNKCPNCSGRLEKSEDGRKLVCPFCSSEFEPEDEISEEPTKEEAVKEEPSEKEEPAEKKEPEKKKEEKEEGGKATLDWGNDAWFEARIPTRKVIKGSSSRQVIECFVKCVGELKTSEKILKYIKTDLKKGTGVAMPGMNDDKLNAFVKRVKEYLDADEKPLIYGNIALLSNGKKGILVTDKRMVIGRSKVTNVPHGELDSVCFDTGDDIPFILLNGNDATKMESIISADYNLMGAMIALCCALSFEQNPGREKIVLTEKKDD
ncbi:MAG: hypothetical protein IJH82_11805 [Lachnospiraceae bacterium]|nr:hypothetical protein [Lachnospiraceae bacterium]